MFKILLRVRQIFCYFLFYGVFNHLPAGDRYGIIGQFCNFLRRILCRCLFKKTEGKFGVGRHVDFGFGSNIIVYDHANIGSNALFIGNGEIILGRHIMMGPGVTIITQDHKYLSEGYDGYIVKSVSIGDYT